MDVPGLKYIPGFVADSDESGLLAAVDAEPWLADLKRRVQHYGYRYDYKARKVDPSLYVGPLPDWAAELAGRLHREGWFDEVPDQLIVNEYQPGQGITRFTLRRQRPDFDRVAAAVGRLSGQQRAEDAAQAKDVTVPADALRLAAGLLRRHVAQRAADGLGAGITPGPP